MKFTFKYPTRSRPDRFVSTLNSYYDMMSNKHDFEFIVTMDKNDLSMNNPRIIKFLNSKKKLKYYYGNSTSKVQAINSNLQESDGDIYVLCSDDMIPQIESYDDIIVEDSKKYFKDSLDFALHYNDGRVKDKLITLSIMGREMFEFFGRKFYHSDYISLWCDNEFTEIVRSMKKVKYIDRVIIFHDWKGANFDTLYRRNESFFARDKKVFLRRKAAKFPKGSIL